MNTITNQIETTHQRLLLLIFVSYLSLLASSCSKAPKPDPKLDPIMDADRTFVFPPGFTPDPGEKGKETLGGMSTDHDGLRDDLKRWIYARFPDEPKKRGAMKQMALAEEAIVMLVDQPTLIRNVRLMVSKATVCMGVTFNDYRSEDYEEGTRLTAKVLNTRMRTERYMKNNSFFNNTVTRLYPDDATACEY